MERVGIGWDIHRFEAGRRLVLCGVEVPYQAGLAGHSDADVALHAVIDALLGAASLGDIGEMFPPDDSHWKDADSGELLKLALQRVQDNGFEPVSADVTIIAEKPRLGPIKPLMRQRLSLLLGLPLEAVNVKAKTSEGLGAVGRGEAIEALAVVLVRRKERLVN